MPNSALTQGLPSRTLNYKVKKEYVLSLSSIHILQCPSLENLLLVWWHGGTPQFRQINYELAFDFNTIYKLWIPSIYKIKLAISTMKLIKEILQIFKNEPRINFSTPFWGSNFSPVVKNGQKIKLALLVLILKEKFLILKKRWHWKSYLSISLVLILD